MFHRRPRVLAEIAVDTGHAGWILAAEQRQRDARPNAIAKLRSGGVRVSDHQDLLDAEPALQ